MREYNDYWIDPSQASPIWIGLVFSILGITMLAYHQYGEPLEYQGRSESLFQLYRTRTSQCLLRGDMTKCMPYTVETLRFNATAELNRKDDNRRGLWIMTGLVVRTAINMGYHRDPSTSSGISILQAEYRRRVWSSIISMDDMASFLGGFPRTMSGVYSDTREPRNLHDWELSEDMTALPPSRPLEESTDVSYLIVKDRLFRQLGRVADFNSSPASSSYETVLEIDRAIHDVYNNFPFHMRVLDSPSSSGGLDSPVVRNLVNFSNLSLMGMFHRGVCTLHRRFLAIGRSDGQFKLSRNRCISSALELLALQERLQPAFYRISQTRQMLMLASMVLFLELALRRKDMNEEEMIPDSFIILQALNKSCDLVAEASDCCEETKKMHHFLVSMLSSFEAAPAETAAVVDMERQPGLFCASPFNLFTEGLPFNEDWSEMDMAWVRAPFATSCLPSENLANLCRLPGTTSLKTPPISLGLHTRHFGLLFLAVF